jgi:uncharacterized membrane protein
MGALLFALPKMTRREILFAVPVPRDFRESPAGKQAVRTFRVVIVAVVAAAMCALLLAPAGLLNAAAAAAPVAILVAGAIGFIWQNRKLAANAVQFTGPREVDLTEAPDQLPRFAWFAAGPFLMLGAAAMWLFLNWDSIPERFPVHWGAAGQPNRWAERTTKGVYGILFFGVELCAWLSIMALAGWFGARRSRTRRVMLGGTIAVEYLLGLLFALISLQAAMGIPVWVIVLAPMAILVPLIAVMVRKMCEPDEPLDPTPNECWKAGIFYYNPNDAVLFVEKRDGFGYTLNFANRWCWALLLGMALVVASAPLLIA